MAHPHFRAAALAFDDWYKTLGRADWPPDCEHVSAACAIALQRHGHATKMIMGRAVGIGGVASIHYWLEVDSVRFDPKGLLLAERYGGGRYTRYVKEAEMLSEEAAENAVEDVDTPAEHIHAALSVLDVASP